MFKEHKNIWWKNKGYENADIVGEKTKAKEELIAVLDQTENTPCIQAIKEKDYKMMSIKTGDVILDVGCGLGFDARRFSPLVGSKGRVVGIDISKDFIKKAEARTSRKTYQNVYFQQESVYKLPFVNSMFDAIHAERLFIHLENPRMAVSELIRVTKPGGRIILTDPDFTTIQFYPGTTQQIQFAIDTIFSQMVLNPRICHQFSMFFSERNLYTETREDTILRTNYAEWDKLLHLEQMMITATSQGLITLEEGIAYLKSLKDADKKCQFTGEHPRITTLAIKSRT